MVPKKPSHATIWVAKEYPPWQSFVLNTLQRLHTENGGKLPDNNVIASTLKAEKSLGKYMKKIMPFVALLKVCYLSFQMIESFCLSFNNNTKT